MKNLFILAVVILVIGAVFNNNGNRQPKKLNDAKEIGQINTDIKKPIEFQYSAVLDTHGAVGGMTGFYDYVTNGNNIHKLWILGDTVLVTVDQTDSANAQLSTARRSYYTASFNGGVTWLPEAILVSPDGNAYPDAIPIISSSQRSICMAGRQFVLGARRGYTGSDVVLGAGTFTITVNPGAGSDNFTGSINSSTIACGWINLTGDSLFYARYSTNTNTYSGILLVTGDPATIATNVRQYTAANQNQNVAIAWWFPTAPTKMFMKESTNNGTSFGSLVTVISSGYLVNGDQVAPWFGADLIYKPNSTTVLMAFNTLAPGNFSTAQGSKLLFWSPTINSGNPVNIADRTNFPTLMDTAGFNNRTSNLQVGMTAVSHPSLAYSTGGTRLFCVYSGVQDDSIIYPTNESYLFNDIYVSYSDNDGATWSVPRNLTNTSAADEIYPTISRTQNSNTAITITYSLSECPGSTSFTNTTTPTCKVWQILRRYNPVTGAEIPIGIINIGTEIPKNYSLSQNYPNPFNPETRIRFSLPKTSNVTIKVFDIIGRLVSVLVNNETVTAGVKEVNFNAANIASGVYYYSIKADNFTETKKMVLVK